MIKLTCDMNPVNSIMTDELVLKIVHPASKSWFYVMKLFLDRGGHVDFWCMFWRLFVGEIREIDNKLDRIRLKLTLNLFVNPCQLAYSGKGAR